MRSRSLVLAAALLTGLTVTAAAQNSPSLFLGGGVTLAVGDFGDYAKSGWLANGGLTFPIGSGGLMLAADAFYGSNTHKVELAGGGGGDSEKTNLYGIMGDVLLRLGNADRIGLYIFGGGGLLAHQWSPVSLPKETTSSFGYQFGAGIDIPISPKFGLWGDIRYLAGTGDNSDTKVFPIIVGIDFGF